MTQQKGRCRWDLAKDLEATTSGVTQVVHVDSRGSYEREARGPEVRVREGDVRTEAEVKAMRGHRSGNAGHLSENAKKGVALAESLWEAPQHCVLDSDLETRREQICAASGHKSVVIRYSGRRELARRATRMEPGQADARSRPDTPVQAVALPRGKRSPAAPAPPGTGSRPCPETLFKDGIRK